MSVKQHTKITRQVDTEHLEKLVSQSVGDPRPTSKMHKDELLGLLDKTSGTAPAVPLLAKPATNAEVDDDRETEILEAKQFRHLAAGSQEITPPPIDSADEALDPAAAEAPRSTEPLPDEPSLAAKPGPHTSEPRRPTAPSKAGPRIVISLLVVTLVASAGFLGLQLAT